MTETQHTLLLLLRIAIGTEAPCDLTARPCDWSALLAEATRQGVKGLVWSAIERLSGEGLVQLPVAAKMEWWGNVRATEQALQGKFRQIADFCSLMQPLQPIVLKGADYARYWPSPLMREFGDLDCSFGGKEADADALACERGCRREDGGYKHSHVFYKGLMIENHYAYVSFASSKGSRSLERSLREFMAKGTTAIEGTGWLAPNADFTALFMSAHACNHFFYEGIALRHILDWLFFLEKEQASVDWEQVQAAMETAGTSRFAEVLTGYCQAYLGWVPRNKAIAASHDDALLKAFGEDVFAVQRNPNDRRWHKMLSRLAHRFKRHYRFGTIATASLPRAMWNALAYSSFLNRKPEFNT